MPAYSKQKNVQLSQLYAYVSKTALNC